MFGVSRKMKNPEICASSDQTFLFEKPLAI